MEHTTLKDALTLKLKWVHTSKVLQMNKLIVVINISYMPKCILLDKSANRIALREQGDC